jgi:hypothetical protein
LDDLRRSIIALDHATHEMTQIEPGISVTSQFHGYLCLWQLRHISSSVRKFTVPVFNNETSEKANCPFLIGNNRHSSLLRESLVASDYTGDHPPVNARNQNPRKRLESD